MIKDMKLPPDTDIRFIDFGTDKCAGLVMKTNTGYLIGINSRMSEADQQKALEHEIYHIEHDHFGMIERGEKTEGQIELETHAVIGQ